MARLAKCKLCGIEIPKDEKLLISNKRYCRSCYDIKIKENEDYTNLKLYICTIFNIDVPSGLVLKQIKQFKEELNYTYAGINYCLWYLTQIKGVKLELKYGIALVKFEYENSKNYYMQQCKIKESVKPPQNIEIKKIIKMKTNRDYKNKFLIDIDDIIKDGV